MKKLKIGVIEDDAVLSKVISEELKDAGFDVVQAFDGEKGLDLIKSEKPDLVLLDLILPKMGGLALLDQLRKSEQGKDIPVIILTIVSEMDKIADALEGGVYTYLIKDKMKIEDLIERVKEELKKSE